MGVGGEAAFRRNGIIAVPAFFQQHTLRLLETDIAEPDSETALQIVLEIQAQFIARNAQLNRKHRHIYRTVSVATLVTPAGKHRFYDRDFLRTQSHFLTLFHHFKRFIGCIQLQSHLRRNHIIAISQETDGKGNQGKKHQGSHTIKKRTIADSAYHRQNHYTRQSVSGIGISIKRKQVFRGVFFDNLSMITHLNNRGISAIHDGNSK